MTPTQLFRAIRFDPRALGTCVVHAVQVTIDEDGQMTCNVKLTEATCLLVKRFELRDSRWFERVT